MPPAAAEEEEEEIFDAPWAACVAAWDSLKDDDFGGGAPELLSEQKEGATGQERWCYTINVPVVARLLLPATMHAYDDVRWDARAMWREEVLTPGPEFDRWWRGRVVCRLRAAPDGSARTQYSKRVEGQSDALPSWMLSGGMGWFMGSSRERRAALRALLAERAAATPPRRATPPPGTPAQPTPDAGGSARRRRTAPSPAALCPPVPVPQTPGTRAQLAGARAAGHGLLHTLRCPLLALAAVTAAAVAARRGAAS